MLPKIKQRLLDKLPTVAIDETRVWLYTQQVLRAWYTYEEQIVRPVLHCCVDFPFLDPQKAKSMCSFRDEKSTVVRHDVSVEPNTEIHALIFLLETLSGKSSSIVPNSDADEFKRPSIVLCDNMSIVKYLDGALSRFGTRIYGLDTVLNSPSPFPAVLDDLIDGANLTLSQYGRMDEAGIHGIAKEVAPLFFMASGRLLGANPFDQLRFGDAFSISISNENERIFCVGMESIDSFTDWEQYKLYLEDRVKGFNSNVSRWTLSFGENSTYSFDDDDAWRLSCRTSGLPLEKFISSFPRVSPVTVDTLSWFMYAAERLADFISTVHGTLREIEVDHEIVNWESEPVDIDHDLDLDGSSSRSLKMKWCGLRYAPDSWIECGPFEDEDFDEKKLRNGNGNRVRDVEAMISELMGACDDLQERVGDEEQEEEEEEDEFVTASDGSEMEFDDRAIEDEEVDAEATTTVRMAATKKLGTNVNTTKECSVCSLCGNPSSFLCSRCHKEHYCSRQCQRSHWPAHKANCK